MNLYTEYLNEIEIRKEQGLHPKPIEDAPLTEELIAQIKDTDHEHRAASLDFFIYNTLLFRIDDCSRDRTQSRNGS